MHPILEEMQRARDVSPRMVGFYGEWTRGLIQYEQELLDQIRKLTQELQGAMAAVKAPKRG